MPTPSFHAGNDWRCGADCTPLSNRPKGIYISSLGSRRKCHQVGLFSIGFLRCDNFEPLLHIVVARKSIGFILFYARLMTCILRILFFSWFLSMVTMFYNFASFKQIWTTKNISLVEVMIESDRGSRRKKISQLEKTIRGWEAKLSLGRLNQITGKGFTGSVTEGCDCMNCRGKLHTSGGGGDFVKCVIFESFSE